MKKIIVLGICMTMLLTGCGDKNTNEQSAPITNVTAEGTTQVESGVTTQNVNSEELNQAKQGNVVEIKEKMFIAQIDDIYLNFDEYKGKTIKYEGLYNYFYDELTDGYISYVYRNSPGCCGDDGIAGFEIRYDGEPINEDEWVEVVGTLETYELDGNEYIRVAVSSMTVPTVRGAEFVSQ